MNTASARTKLNIPVRWPFRALAGVILMTGLMAVAGSAYIDWTHDAAPSDVRLHLLCFRPLGFLRGVLHPNYSVKRTADRTLR
jgi:hypothetical protein